MSHRSLILLAGALLLIASVSVSSAVHCQLPIANCPLPIDLSSPPDPAKVLEEQRSRGQAAQRLLGVAVRTFESEHFIVHSTFDEAQGKDVPALAEAVYRQFVSVFKVAPDEFTWTGKVVVYALARREEFAEFSAKAHGFAGNAAGAYFRAAGAQAELVVPRNGDMERFRQDLTHEGTHLLLHFYRKPGGVPNWLQEGLAQWFEFKAFPDCKACTDSRALLKKDPAEKLSTGLADIVKDDRPRESSDLAGYSYVWGFVAYLVEKRPGEFVAFVRELKDGAGREQAAQKAFGEGFAQLVDSWARQVPSDK